MSISCISVNYQHLLSGVILFSTCSFKPAFNTNELKFDYINSYSVTLVKRSERGKLDDSKQGFWHCHTDATYPGGEDSLMNQVKRYVTKHYPSIAVRNHVMGRLTVNFMVDEEGLICNFSILRGEELGFRLPDVAIAALRSLKGKWNPSRDCQGNPVKASFSVPVTFKLSNAR